MQEVAVALVAEVLRQLHSWGIYDLALLSIVSVLDPEVSRGDGGIVICCCIELFVGSNGEGVPPPHPVPPVPPLPLPRP